MKHINITNWQGNITDWTKFNYVYGGLDETIADRVNLHIKGTNLRNYIKKSDNLLPLPNKPQADFYGLNYKVENGVISVWGTATNSVNLWLNLGTVLPANTRYYINFFHEGDHEGNIVYNIAKEQYDWTNRIYAPRPQFTFNVNYSMSAICLQFDANKQYNCTFKPMIVYGDVMPTTYEPYGSMVMVENVGKAFIDSNCTFEAGTYRVYVNLSDMQVAPTRTLSVSMNGYTCISGGQTYDPTWDKVIYNGYSTLIYVTNKAYISKVEWVEKEGNNPILYPLAEPKITIFNQVDLGSLEWAYRAMGAPSYYDAYLPGVVNSINISCPLYKSAWVFSTNTEDKVICTVQNAVRVRDNALEGSVIDLNSKLKGVIMFYEPANQSNANTLSMSSPMQLQENVEETEINEESVD